MSRLKAGSRLLPFIIVLFLGTAHAADAHPTGQSLASKNWHWTGWFPVTPNTAWAYGAAVNSYSGFPIVLTRRDKNLSHYVIPSMPPHRKVLRDILGGIYWLAVMGPGGSRIALKPSGKAYVAAGTAPSSGLMIPDVSNDGWGDPSLGVKPGKLYVSKNQWPVSALFDMTMPGKYRIEILLPHAPKKVSDRYLSVRVTLDRPKLLPPNAGAIKRFEWGSPRHGIEAALVITQTGGWIRSPIVGFIYLRNVAHSKRKISLTENPAIDFPLASGTWSSDVDPKHQSSVVPMTRYGQFVATRSRSKNYVTHLRAASSHDLASGGLYAYPTPLILTRRLDIIRAGSYRVRYQFRHTQLRTGPAVLNIPK